MQFQQDCPKDKKLTAHLIFCLKTFRSTELYGAALEGSTITLSQLFGLYVNGKLSISWFEICNFQQHRM